MSVAKKARLDMTTSNGHGKSLLDDDDQVVTRIFELKLIGL